MSQGNDFANYSPAAAPGSAGSEDVWFVAVASDDIKQMTVDQLDEAFRLGVITAETPVWTEGMDAWAPLGQVADLDNDSSGGAENGGTVPAAAPPTVETPAYAVAGAAFNGGVSAGSELGAGTLPSFPHGPSSISPVTASFAPSAPPGRGAVPVSLGDEELPALQRQRRFRPERWAFAAAALVAVGVVGYNSMFSSSVASAGTDSEQPTALAAHPYQADGVDTGEKLNAPAAASDAEEEAAPSAATGAALAGGAAAAAMAASANQRADRDTTEESAKSEDEAEAPSSAKGRASSKESLRGSFSKAFGKKSASKARAKPRPRKASRAAKARAKARAKSSKKSGVVRSESAFDPLNDSLP